VTETFAPRLDGERDAASDVDFPFALAAKGD
jgi:hypothetical protein